MRADDPVLAWLLQPSQPAMRYLASRDLLDPRPSAAELERLRAQAAARGWAAAILARQREGTWWAAKRTAYSPKFRSTVWQLQVLADLGCARDDPRIARAVEFFLGLHHDARGGGYRCGAGRPGGALHVDDAWMRSYAGASHLCLTGNMVRSLVRMGYLDDDRVQSAVAWLVDQQLDDGGWDCFGRKRGTLDAWEAMSGLAEVSPRRRSRAVRAALARGAAFFLQRGALHEGPRFERWSWCRYPWHYHYDHLVGLDFLSALGHGGDGRLEEAWANLLARRRPDGRWALDHTNGNLVVEPKGKPSRMITFLALRALRRAGMRVPGGEPA